METIVAERVDAPSEVPSDDRNSLHARTARLAKAVLVALVLGVIVITITAPGIGTAAAAAPDAPRLGGDFPAFFAAGSIVGDGDIGQLYDPARQELAQADLGIDGYLAFAYPPHVAVAYSPLSALGFRLGYLLHTALMAGAFVIAVRLIGTMIDAVARWRWQILAASFTFYPLLTSVGGGQNATLTVAGFAVAWWALHNKREVLAGVAAGLLAFRPQYALPLIGVMFLARHWRAVAAASATIVTTWALTAIALGPAWLGHWFEQVGPFIERDAEVNAANSISILGFLQAIFGTESTPILILGVAGAASVVATLMFMWWRTDRFSLADRMGALAIGVLLISPHTMFYDATTMTIAGAALLARVTQPRFNRVAVLAAVWLAAILHLANDYLGATPLAIIVVGSFIAFVATSGRESAHQVQAPELAHA